MFAYGTSRKVWAMVDTRKPAQPAFSSRNDAMVNALLLLSDGVNCLTGDHAGQLKLWDIRQPAQPVWAGIVDAARRKPIAHLACLEGILICKI